MKRFMITIFALLLAVSLAGCSFDSLGDYKKAAEKTEQIKKGQMSGEFTLVTDFNTDGMTEDEIKEMNYFKNMKGSFSAVYDDDAGKGIFRNYLNFGGLGFDFDLFMNEKEVFMKLPVLGKYMRLDEMQAPMIKEQGTGEPELISRETQDELNAKWLGLLTKEDVFKGKDIVLTTPDGEVKTKEYTIKLNDEQIKSLAADSLDIVSKDEKLKENYEKYIKKNVEPLKDTSFEKLVLDIEENIKDYIVESFNYTAYVDIDGYIVNEVVEFAMKVEGAGAASMKGFNYKLELKNWDINKEQEFDFPVLTEENTVNMDQMDQNMPFMMEDLFNNKD